jgi:hypothetical protein
MYKFSSYDFDNNVGVFASKDSGNKIINPLNATHSCCLGDPLLPGTWKVAPDTEICFTDPEPKCAGKIPQYTDGSGFTQNKGYILEQQKTFCDGVRGNSCKDGITEGEKFKGELRCGKRSPSSLQCNKVHTDCQDVLSWGYVKDDDDKSIAWCHGQMGCQDVCSDFVVDISPEKKSQLSGFAGVNIVANEDPLLPDTDKDVGFDCGCQGNLDAPCDANYDGKFQGICQSDGGCSE